MKERLGHCGKDCNFLPRFSGARPEKIFLEDYTLIQPGSTFIMAGGTFTLKKWSCLSLNCTVITGNHRPTVGVCQRIVDRYHLNDEETDVVVGEDCWVGANVTLLAGANVGRGSIVGACSLLNKVTPPVCGFGRHTRQNNRFQVHHRTSYRARIKTVPSRGTHVA